MPTTEIAVMPLIAGTAIGDPDSHAAAVMRDTVATLHQQDGLLNVYFGSQIESPDVLQMMISKKFSRISQLYGTKPSTKHLSLQAGPRANTTKPSWPPPPTALLCSV